jgi:hypothetical protein
MRRPMPIAHAVVGRLTPPSDERVPDQAQRLPRMPPDSEITPERLKPYLGGAVDRIAPSRGRDTAQQDPCFPPRLLIEPGVPLGSDGL